MSISDGEKFQHSQNFFAKTLAELHESSKTIKPGIFDCHLLFGIACSGACPITSCFACYLQIDSHSARALTMK
jgi:hypothetical protein